MILFIDNYDSFSYILLDYLKQIGLEALVYRNDGIDWNHLDQNPPAAIVLSPGPGAPAQSGDLMRIIETYHQSTPILGICLGHQALGVFFGAQLHRSTEPVHGIPNTIMHTEHSIFTGVPNPFTAMRYHSLELIAPLPGCLEIICYTTDRVVMGMVHKTLPLTGFQFHPESVGTSVGLNLLSNWKRSIEQLRETQVGKE